MWVTVHSAYQETEIFNDSVVSDVEVLCLYLVIRVRKNMRTLKIWWKHCKLSKFDETELVALVGRTD